ncbi:MAG: molybdopterin-dependent oxidoreductase [Candidatus Bathyarchaeota archaeon]|nr:molybdopterin-dependent oxidoreductase [Candidatus Bathyarchaeota archaeon]
MTSQPKKRKTNPKLIAAIAIAIIIVSSASAAAIYIFNQPPQIKPTTTELSDLTITLVGADGQQKTLNKNDLLALQSVTGDGGILSHATQVSGVGAYTGVPVKTLLNLVGGVNIDQTVTVKATDGYTMTYTYNQVASGEEFATYNASTLSQTAPTQPVQLVLTYYRDGTVLPDDEGPLRMGVLGREGLITQGNLWVKWVIQLTVNPSAPVTSSPTQTSTATTAATHKPVASTAPTTAPTATPTPTPTAVPITGTQLTVVAANGTQITLDSNQLMALTSVSGTGGTKSGIGLGNYGIYTGVPLLTICSLVGGFSSTNIIRFTASDNYVTTYTYQQAHGQDIPMYDQNQNSATPTHGLTVIIAHHLNGTALPHETSSDPGPLRIMAIGSDGYYMQGNLSPRMVVKIEIL